MCLTPELHCETQGRWGGAGEPQQTAYKNHDKTLLLLLQPRRWPGQLPSTFPASEDTRVHSSKRPPALPTTHPSPQPCSHIAMAEVFVRGKLTGFFFFQAGNKDVRLFLAFLLFIQDLPNRLCDFYAAFFSTKSFERQNNRKQIRKKFGYIGPKINPW